MWSWPGAPSHCPHTHFAPECELSWAGSSTSSHSTGFSNSPGLKPDLNRGRIATMLALTRRNGTMSLGRKRGL
jgi:hypothetical protein